MDLTPSDALYESAQNEFAESSSRELEAEQLNDRIAELEEAIRQFMDTKTTGAMFEMFDLLPK